MTGFGPSFFYIGDYTIREIPKNRRFLNLMSGERSKKDGKIRKRRTALDKMIRQPKNDRISLRSRVSTQGGINTYAKLKPGATGLKRAQMKDKEAAKNGIMGFHIVRQNRRSELWYLVKMTILWKVVKRTVQLWNTMVL